MPSEAPSAPVSKGLFWTGWAMSALPALFLLVDGAMKLVQPEVVVKTTVELGYAEAVILPLGIVLLAYTILYLIPRTAVLGAILLTGSRCVASNWPAGMGYRKPPPAGKERDLLGGTADDLDHVLRHAAPL